MRTIFGEWKRLPGGGGRALRRAPGRRHGDHDEKGQPIPGTATEEGILHGRIEFINDLVTFEAETVPKLKAAFRKAVDEYVKTCATIGKEPEKSFSGSFNVRIGPELHRQAALAAKRSEIALNEFVRKAVEGQLKGGDAPVVVHKHDHTFHHV